MKLQIKPFLTAALFALAAISTPALSQETRWYLGGSIGQSQFDQDLALVTALGATGVTTEDSDTGFKIYGGYQFTRNWGIEVGYIDFGSTEVRGTAGGGSFRVNIDLTALTVAGVGTLPLNPNFSLFGKAGVYVWDAKAGSSGTIVAAGNDGIDPMVGIGVLYNLNRNLGVQAEFEHFAGDDTINFFSIGLRYKF